MVDGGIDIWTGATVVGCHGAVTAGLSEGDSPDPGALWARAIRSERLLRRGVGNGSGALGGVAGRTGRANPRLAAVAVP